MSEGPARVSLDEKMGIWEVRRWEEEKKLKEVREGNEVIEAEYNLAVSEGPARVFLEEDGRGGDGEKKVTLFRYNF